MKHFLGAAGLVLLGLLAPPALFLASGLVPQAYAPADAYVLPMLGLAVGAMVTVACWAAAAGLAAAGVQRRRWEEQGEDESSEPAVHRRSS